jgi:hypothetical protein
MEATKVGRFLAISIDMGWHESTGIGEEGREQLVRPSKASSVGPGAKNAQNLDFVFLRGILAL